MSTLLDILDSKKIELHGNSNYHEKKIDVQLLVKDYLFIYNYLLFGKDIDIAYRYKVYNRVIDYSSQRTIMISNWRLYTYYYDNDLFIDTNIDNMIRPFAEINNFINFYHLEEPSSYKRVFILKETLSEHNDAAYDMVSRLEFNESVVENIINERLFIIEDYMSTNTVPDKCVDLSCDSCIFKNTCPKSL